MGRLFISFETEPNLDEADVDEAHAAGQSVFGELVGHIRKRGVQIVEPPSEWDAYGWYITVAIGQAELTCMLQRSDQWLIQVFPNRGLLDRLRGRQHSAETQSLAEVVCVAATDAFGIASPQWQTEAEFIRQAPSH